MAVNETTTVVEEYEYSEDGYLLKKTTTTTTRATAPAYPAGGQWPYGSGPRPHYLWNKDNGSYLDLTVGKH